MTSASNYTFVSLWKSSRNCVTVNVLLFDNWVVEVTETDANSRVFNGNYDTPFAGLRIFNDIAAPGQYICISSLQKRENKIKRDRKWTNLFFSFCFFVSFLFVFFFCCVESPFPSFGRRDRKSKSVTEETLLSHQSLCSRSLPLRPFVRTTIRSSGTLFLILWSHLFITGRLDSTRLDFTRGCVSTPPPPRSPRSPPPGWIHFTKQKNS